MEDGLKLLRTYSKDYKNKKKDEDKKRNSRISKQVTEKSIYGQDTIRIKQQQKKIVMKPNLPISLVRVTFKS